MSEKPPAFDRVDRQRSLAALDLIQIGISRTAQSTEQCKSSGTHPQVGELIMVPRTEIAAMLQQFFVTVTFARDMVEQLAGLEKLTGVKAEPTTLGRYEGVLIPREAKSLEIDGIALYMMMDTPSTLVPSHMISVKKEIAVADRPTDTGEIFTLGQLKAAVEAFNAERARPN